MSSDSRQTMLQNSNSTLILKHENDPGCSEISYRVGTYTTVLQRLKTYLALHRTEDVGLHLLDLYAEDSLAVALLEAWAILIDILSFYQERIANEGYLRTATELRSVQELVGTVGYEPRPGVAASVYLAFTVRQTATSSARRSMIPAGTVIQSIPTRVQPLGLATDARPQIDRAQLPQTFETSADFEARVEWNALKPGTVTFEKGHILKSNLTTLRLAGINTGLRPGDSLLIVGEHTTATDTATAQAEPVWIFAMLTAVEANRIKNYTQVTWTDSEKQSNDGTLIRNPQVFVLRQKTKLYGYQQGGVYYSPLDAASWSPASIGLPPSNVYALALHKTAGLLAGTDNGVFRSSHPGEYWEASSSGLLNSKISALTVSDASRIYAGSTTGSLFCSVDGGKNWKLLVSKPPRRTTLLGFSIPGQSLPAVSLPKNIVRKIATFSTSGTNYLAVALDDGVFLSVNQGATWKQIHPGTLDAKRKPDGGAWSFVSTHQSTTTFVGMDTGAFPIDVAPHPPLWWKISLGIIAAALVLLGLSIFNWNTGFAETLHLPNIVSILLNEIAPPAMFILPVLLVALVALLAFLVWGRIEKWLQEKHAHAPGAIQTLALGQNDALLAGTAHGVYRSSDNGENWTRAEQGADNDIRVLEAYAPQHLFAGTHDGAIFRSQDDGVHWENYLPASPFASIQDLQVDSSGIFAAGTLSSTDINGQWSRFHVQNRQIYLDKVYPALKAGGWAVLRQDQQMELYKVESVSQAMTGDYRKVKPVTCLGVDRSDHLSTFDRRTALLFAQSEQLIPYSDEPIEGTSILLNSSVPELTPDRCLVLQGKRARVRILDTLSQDLVLVSADGLQEVPFDQSTTYVLMAPSADPHANASTWLLRDRNGFVGSLTTSTNVVVTYEPANDDDETVGEMVTLKEVQQQVATENVQQKEQTLLTFQSPLQNAYDRATVIIYANIVHATHGQTIANEILDNRGSTSNASRYTLKQKPLTYVPAATPDGIQSTLSVMVNQVRWHQASSLQALNTMRRSYLLRRDSQDNTTIYFGAGSQSGKLPTGTEQLTATYRIGIGEVGNVAANSLTLLRTRPAGIQKVTNPLPATGGTDPDTLEQMRTLAPLQSCTTQRIVSLQDYEYFVRMFPGVGKIQVKALYNNHRRLVHITIAGNNASPVTTDSALYSDLQTALQAATTSPTKVVSLDSFEPLYFQLRARLLIAPDCLDQRDTIMANATRAISAAFSFEQRELAQNIAASEIITLLQRVPDVLAVELKSLHIKDVQQDETLNTLLEARTGRNENGRLLPAQMLLIDTKNNEGIDLHVEVLS